MSIVLMIASLLVLVSVGHSAIVPYLAYARATFNDESALRCSARVFDFASVLKRLDTQLAEVDSHEDHYVG